MSEERYDLKESKRSVQELYPVLRDAYGNVIDGNHRLEADPKWRSETLKHIRTPTQLALARIVANTHRRAISREERAEQIRELASTLTEHDEVPREEIVVTIADLTTFTERYVRDLLPGEYKRSYTLPDKSELSSELDEAEGAGAEEFSGTAPGTVEEYVEEARAYIEEHGLENILEGDPGSSTYLTKLSTLPAEALEFCLAHETRPLSIRRLNEETDRRGTDRSLKPLLKAPSSSATDPRIVASINRMVGEPVEAIPAKLVEEHGLTEEEADAALESYRETYPDIWSICYPEETEDQESEEPMTAEEYVADVLMHNPEVGHEELTRVTAEMFDVSEADAQSLVDRMRKRRGRKPRDPTKPTIPCPLCGRANAEINKLLMVLEAYQSQPRVTVVDWLTEVLA